MIKSMLSKYLLSKVNQFAINDCLIIDHPTSFQVFSVLSMNVTFLYTP